MANGASALTGITFDWLTTNGRAMMPTLLPRLAQRPAIEHRIRDLQGFAGPAESRSGNCPPPLSQRVPFEDGKRDALGPRDSSQH